MTSPPQFSSWAIVRDPVEATQVWTAPLLLGLTLVLAVGMTPSVQAQSSPVPEGTAVEKVADGFEFTEGPLWHDGRLVFSDIPADRVYQWTPAEGHSVFLAPSGHANGLAIGADERLLLAQHDGQVGRLMGDDQVESLAQSYEGKRLNSPNDLTVADDGTIYFTRLAAQ